MSKLLAVFSLALLLLSCTSDDAKMVRIDGKWKPETIQKIDFKIDDSQNPKNIIFVVRNNNEYPYSNIRFIVDFSDLKTKKTETDTLNYVLAQPNGEWLGKGFGETKEILFQYKTDYKFPENGAYQIAIKQAMRNNALPGIEDIGIKIENSKP